MYRMLTVYIDTSNNIYIYEYLYAHMISFVQYVLTHPDINHESELGWSPTANQVMRARLAAQLIHTIPYGSSHSFLKEVQLEVFGSQ